MSVKVIVAFDRDPKKIGKTITVDDAEAHVMLAEGRARLAEGQDYPVAFQAPTTTPPTPDVVVPGDMVPAVGADTGARTSRRAAKAGKAPTDGSGSAAS